MVGFKMNSCFTINRVVGTKLLKMPFGKDVIYSFWEASWWMPCVSMYSFLMKNRVHNKNFVFIGKCKQPVIVIGLILVISKTMMIHELPNLVCKEFIFGGYKHNTLTFLYHEEHALKVLYIPEWCHQCLSSLHLWKQLLH